MSILAGKATRILIGVIFGLLLLSLILIAMLVRNAGKLAVAKDQRNSLEMAYEAMNQRRLADLKKIHEREHERRELNNIIEGLQDEHKRRLAEQDRRWGGTAVPDSYGELVRDAAEAAARMSSPGKNPDRAHASASDETKK